MKRKGEEKIRTAKRICSSFFLEEVVFPNIPQSEKWGDWKEVNFYDYGRANETDVTVSNGSVEFISHKHVLQAVSSVFQAFFDGDNSIQTLHITDVDDFTLEWLEKFLYSKSNLDDISQDFASRSKNAWMFYVHSYYRDNPDSSLESVLCLINKYDVKPVSVFFKDFFFGESFELSILCRIIRDARNFDIPWLIHKLDSMYLKREKDEDLKRIHGFDVPIVLEACTYFVNGDWDLRYGGISHITKTFAQYAMSKKKSGVPILKVLEPLMSKDLLFDLLIARLGSE